MQRSFIDRVEGAGAIAAGAALGGALATILAQIIARFVFNASLVWSEELARYLLVWSVMIGTAVAYRRAEHIAVVILAERLGPGLLTALSRLVNCIVGGFSLVLLYQSALLTMRTFERSQLSTAMQLEMGWVYLAIPVGALLLVLVSLEKLITGEAIPTDLTGEEHSG